MKSETVGDKLVVRRTPEELMPYKQRLARIEGQVRGLRQMIENHRYCGEAVQQSSAIMAAVREVTLMLITQQLHSQAERLNGQGGDKPEGPPVAVNDFIATLRSSYRFQ